MDSNHIDDAREAVARAFRWIDGHADVWALAEDAAAFAAVTRGLASLAAPLAPTAIVGIETRGVLFGAAVARELGLGFHTLRKTDGLFAGAAAETTSAPDYLGRSQRMRARSALGAAGRVVLIDDWIERGSQAAAARELVTAVGATWLGVVAIVDDRTADAPDVGPVVTLVTASDLGPDS